MPIRRPSLLIPTLVLLVLGGGSSRAAEGPAVAPAGGVVPMAAVDPAATPVVLGTFDQPFTYAFLAWKDTVKVIDGAAVLPKVPTTGGAGYGKAPDVAGRASWSPALRLRVGPDNTARTIAFRLVCPGTTGEGSQVVGGWTFTLPPAGTASTLVLPVAGAPFSTPLSLQDGSGTPVAGGFDLKTVIGWQLIGDWQPGVLDVVVEEVLAVPPDTALLAKRAAAADELAARERERAQAATDAAARLVSERAEKVKRYPAGAAEAPTVTAVGVVAPDIIALTIEAQRVVKPTFGRYEAQPGDEVRPLKPNADRPQGMAELVRDGHAIGWLQGKGLAWFNSFEELAGDPLLEFVADDVANYAISSNDDPAFAAAAKPVAVYRKSIPTDWQQRMNNFPARHRVYLKLARPLTAGKTYAIATGGLNLRAPPAALVYDDRTLVCESVHASQLGFRPDDPGKRAFLSQWLGSGGALTYSAGPAGLRFAVVDEADGTVAFEGPVELVLPADGTEKIGARERPTTSNTAVYRMDFAAVTRPGRYHVRVAGLGRSLPFDIGTGVWEHAFKVQMRGLYNNRCGVELGEPYTSFKKPRDFHPADGTVVTRSAYDTMTKGEHDYESIPKGDTGEVVPDAWGGYHDAGDWNPRRVSHMSVTMAQLELMEMFPGYFAKLELRIPKEDGVPDIVTEALFEIDCFRRLQRADGAIPYGLESDGDPLPGEISWLSSQHVYVLAPTIRDSWYYAAVAGRAAKVLQPLKPALAEVYRASAVKAFAWAEAEYARRKAEGSLAHLQELWRAVDHRNLSSLVLFDLTGDKAYDTVFREDTRLSAGDGELNWWGKWMQNDAAFLYARMDQAKTDPQLRKTAVLAVEKQARRAMEYAGNNAFGLTNNDTGRPLFCGFFSTPGGTEPLRAYHLTGKEEYLTTAVRSCLFGGGANPNNLVYTTGLGVNPVKHPLHVDARMTGQTPPEGLTVFGNLDYWQWKGGFWDWPVKFINKPETCWPDAYSWPLTEAYFDVHLFVSQNEFVIDTWTPNVFVWGYLAARGSAK